MSIKRNRNEGNVDEIHRLLSTERGKFKGTWHAKYNLFLTNVNAAASVDEANMIIDAFDSKQRLIKKKHLIGMITRTNLLKSTKRKFKSVNI